MIDNGNIIVFEGPDGVGKTATMKKVGQGLRCIGASVIETKMPTDRAKYIVYDGKFPEFVKINALLHDYALELEMLKDHTNSYKDHVVVLMDRSPLMSIPAYNFQKFEDASVEPIYNLFEQFIKYDDFKIDTYLIFDRPEPFVKPTVERDGIFADYDQEFIYDFYAKLKDQYHGVPCIKLYSDNILDTTMNVTQVTAKTMAVLANRGYIK